MLQVSQLTRLYDRFVAVEQVSFDIGKGEIVGLLGHNGAGKTTIMKMLCGYLEPNLGQIKFDGIDLAIDPRTVQQHLGYLPEGLALYPEMTAADYLDYAADLKGLHSTIKRTEIRRVIDATDLKAKLLAPISTLSRGYKQRLGVAQAILGNPRLLILDEPTSGLDPTQTEHMRQLICDIAHDAAVILSTHIMQEVDAICDRVLILQGGWLVVDARLEALRTTNHLLLTTTMPPGTAVQQLTALAGVASLEVLTDSQNSSAPSSHRYRLTLSHGQEANLVSATVAQTIIDAGDALYQLRPEQRNLETLFREVSDAHAVPGRTRAVIGEGLSDAA